MNEAKPFASLSSSLLARKGHAKPAMRPQSFHMVPGPAPQVLDGFPHDQHDDLGWNDMGLDDRVNGHEANGHEFNIHGLNGHELDSSAPVPIREDQAVVEPVAPPPVVEQREALAREFTMPAPTLVEAAPVAKILRPRAAPGSKGKAAFTLRLDAERHLRLRMVCAVNHRSAQQIVTKALDEFLARQPDNAALAAGAGQ